MAAQSTDPPKRCENCGQVKQYSGTGENCVLTLKETMEEVAMHLDKFFANINALLNGKGGSVIIHANEPECLMSFDEKLSKRLKEMIPDGSFFHNVYDRKFIDVKHVLFRVKPVSGQRPFSTMDFRSKVSLDQGRDDPSHYQMRTFVEKISQPEEEHDATSVEDCSALKLDKQQLKRGEEVKLDGLPFQESMRVQAKHTREEQDMVTHFMDGGLAEYVCAFSKILNGGSIFLGIAEQERKKTRTLNKVKYKCMGLPLSDKEKENFKSTLKTKILETTAWYGIATPADPPVTIELHPVTCEKNRSDNKGYFVVEVKVGYFHGLSFHNEEGPEAYRWPISPEKPQAGASTLTEGYEQIPIEEWFESFGSNALSKIDFTVKPATGRREAQPSTSNPSRRPAAFPSSAPPAKRPRKQQERDY